MRHGWSITPIFAAIVLSGSPGVAEGTVIELDDRDQWIAVVGAYTTVDFTGLPHATFITTQYADVGIIFTDGDDQVVCCSEITYPNDGAGVDGNGNITLTFDRPKAWIAADFPGRLVVQLFADGEVIYSSGIFGVGGYGNFGGLVSSELFDTAVLMDFPVDFEAEIDDLHFGPPPCLADMDADGIVGITDFLDMLALWGTDPGGPPDLDGDGTVGITDFLDLLAAWGPCPFFVDCNGDGVWDLLELWEGTSPDCNANGAPDECDLAAGTSPDCNDNNIPDECDLAAGTSPDCNDNNIPDECDLANGTSPDCNVNDVPDECEPDCDENGIPDECDIADGTSEDLDGNGIPDVCEFPNDNCEDAVVVTDGATPFSTVGANTDGYPAFCEGGEGTTFVRDIWFLYTAPCTAIATFSVCNAADFDTRVVEGFTYLIRIGGTDWHGTGVLTISCDANP
jgi:hypothetical protein